MSADSNKPLFDPKTLSATLRAASAWSRREGDRLFQNGSVSNIEFCGDTEVLGTVADPGFGPGGSLPVGLEWEPAEKRWLWDCACDHSSLCPHAFALGKAALAEQSRVAVDRLSSSTAKDAAAAQPTGTSLAEAAAKALHRELTAKEELVISSIGKLFKQYGKGASLPTYELRQAGIRSHDLSTFKIVLAPFPLTTELAFWTALHPHYRRLGQAIPSPLQTIPLDPETEERLERWQEETLLREWSVRIGALVEDAAKKAQTQPPTHCEIRIHMTAEVEIELLHRTNPDEPFRPCDPQTLMFLSRLQEEGQLALPEADKLLWALVSPLILSSPYGLVPQTSANTITQACLARVLREESLHGHVLTESLIPFEFPEDPLRWRVLEPEAGSGYYSFQLVDDRGRQAPPILISLDGRPGLHITKKAIYKGPSQLNVLLDPAKITRVPAAVLESDEGLRLMGWLEIPVPKGLQERIQRVPMPVTIRCELRPVHVGASREMCLFDIRAANSTEHWEAEYGPTGWTFLSRGRKTRAAARKGKSSGSPNIQIADRTWMDRVPGVLEPLNLEYDPTRSVRVLKVRKNFAEVFADWIRSLPPEFHLELDEELAGFRDNPVVGRVSLDIREASKDWFDLQVVLDVKSTELTPEEIKLLLNAKGGFVRLEGKGWKRLEFNLPAEDDQHLANLGLSAREFGSEPQRLHVLQLAHTSAGRFLSTEQADQVTRRAEELKARVTPPLPAGIQATLRPYQSDGYHFLAYLATNRFGGILADDMGLGKTLQTLTWLVWLRQEEAGGKRKAQPSLVVCPKSVMENWGKECGRFAPSLSVRTWQASELPKLAKEVKDHDLHIINYNQLRIASEDLKAIPWLTVILDEGQYIKNASSQTSQVARQLEAGHRLVLTGTPIENRLQDLWSLMAFAMPGMLGSRTSFGKLYNSADDPLARRRLASRVRPFLIRRTKSQVARDLPDRIEEELLCEMEGEQKLLYQAELKRAQQMLLRIKTQKELAGQTFHVLTALLRLRQICCSPKLVKSDSNEDGAKLEGLMDHLEPLVQEGHKVLVFSQFTEMLNLIRAQVKAKDWRHFYLAGDTENRGELVESFQNEPGSAVFLISLKAGGFGLNLTAASYVVLFDPWWNPAVENQAIDRTHRIGQKNTVNAYRLIVKGSIEEKIRALQRSKANLVEEVLGEERFSQSLTLDDLRFLFADAPGTQ